MLSFTQSLCQRVRAIEGMLEEGGCGTPWALGLCGNEEENSSEVCPRLLAVHMPVNGARPCIGVGLLAPRARVRCSVPNRAAQLPWWWFLGGHRYLLVVSVRPQHIRRSSVAWAPLGSRRRRSSRLSQRGTRRLRAAERWCAAARAPYP